MKHISVYNFTLFTPLNAFPQTGGLEPLIKIPSLPNIAIQFASSRACMDVAITLKDILVSGIALMVNFLRYFYVLNLKFLEKKDFHFVPAYMEIPATI